jgi:hypothetical protein
VTDHTTSAASQTGPWGELTQQQVVGEFEIRRASHAPAAIETLLAQHAFTRLKLQKCLVGDDQFLLWITRRDFSY